jgi:hypothetical protein
MATGSPAQQGAEVDGGPSMFSAGCGAGVRSCAVHGLKRWPCAT